ncbi:hypothetical protein ACQP1G_21150 [Nocardia sp. CA-107356]|uniref:hypothetical protein n=1 Tax=Nocardia sp. CA-107356 TaxID=3239972 RepID=UPI003D8D1D26
MSSATNLANPRKPFGDPGRSTGAAMPTVVALAVTPLGVGLVYATFSVQEPRDLGADQRGFTFGYEVLNDATSQTSLTVELDGRITECNRHAEVITGHDLAGALKPLCSTVQGQVELVSLDKYALLWAHRREQRTKDDVSARMVDTAADLDISASDLRTTCTAAKLSSWYLEPNRDSWRGPITAALASALLTARSMGGCSWQRLDLDPLVTESEREQR